MEKAMLTALISRAIEHEVLAGELKMLTQMLNDNPALVEYVEKQCDAKVEAKRTVKRNELTSAYNAHCLAFFDNNDNKALLKEIGGKLGNIASINDEGKVVCYTGTERIAKLSTTSTPGNSSRGNDTIISINGNEQNFASSKKCVEWLATEYGKTELLHVSNDITKPLASVNWSAKLNSQQWVEKHFPQVTVVQVGYKSTAAELIKTSNVNVVKAG